MFKRITSANLRNSRKTGPFCQLSLISYEITIALPLPSVSSVNKQHFCNYQCYKKKISYRQYNEIQYTRPYNHKNTLHLHGDRVCCLYNIRYTVLCNAFQNIQEDIL